MKNTWNTSEDSSKFGAKNIHGMKEMKNLSNP